MAVSFARVGLEAINLKPYFLFALRIKRRRAELMNKSVRKTTLERSPAGSLEKFAGIPAGKVMLVAADCR